jgi:hypothetical protein
MVYWNAYGSDDDDLQRFDFEEVMQDCRDHEAQITEVTGERDIQVGMHNSDAYDFEVWADGGKFGLKTRYFANFADLREEVKTLYPNADWEEVGW